MAFLIADNRLRETGTWNEQLLGEQLKILSELELDFDLEAIGFEVPEIDLLIDGLNTVPQADPDDRLPEISDSAVTVSGDLWELGKHRVLCGNSLVTASYEPLMDGAKADLVITDAPYNVRIDGHAPATGRSTAASSRWHPRDELRRVHRFPPQGDVGSPEPQHRRVVGLLFHGLSPHDGDPVRRTSVYTDLLNLCVWVNHGAGGGHEKLASWYQFHSCVGG
jgi:hypothetical protein